MLALRGTNQGVLDNTFAIAAEEAGGRMRTTAVALRRMDIYEAALTQELHDIARETLEAEYDKEAGIVVDQSTYRTAAEYQEDQGVFLKALDFADEVGPDIRMYNVCNQPHWHYGKCGLAFPSKLWWQKGKGTRFGHLKRDPTFTTSQRWSFKCMCEWGYLKEEAQLKTHSEAAKWFDELSVEYGSDYHRWPSVGCGGGFRAFANGASMVVELKIDGEYQAFVSERLPESLDDAIKNRNYKAFKAVCQTLSPQELYDSLPMCFPMKHTLTMGGKPFRGIARYPLAEWERKGEPVMTRKHWAKFCMKIAAKDHDKLEYLFRKAKEIDDEPEPPRPQKHKSQCGL